MNWQHWGAAQLSDPIKSTYCCMVCSLLVPLRLFRASHLARPTMSPKPGFFSVLSPPGLPMQGVHLQQAWRYRAARWVLELVTAASKVALSWPWVLQVGNKTNKLPVVAATSSGQTAQPHCGKCAVSRDGIGCKIGG